ncbi:hypothetical protein AAFP35_24335 [Gordonia sp. CPCC 206044]|uniref:DUF6907 domain-containing protein n=1 Tax=Gordonia sp. CPCC 206044 TaxID=3140793 RepID=UPI003AF34F37
MTTTATAAAVTLSQAQVQNERGQMARCAPWCDYDNGHLDGDACHHHVDDVELTLEPTARGMEYGGATVTMPSKIGAYLRRDHRGTHAVLHLEVYGRTDTTTIDDDELMLTSTELRQLADMATATADRLDEGKP